jgi:hypothetical protein
VEQDPRKLMELILREIDRLLEEKENRLAGREESQAKGAA